MVDLLELIEFFNQNSGVFNVIFSFIVTCATVAYAILTWKLVTETKKMREVQTEPMVSVTIQPRKEWISLLDMNIQNIGLGPAFNVIFTVKPDFEYAKGELLSNLGFIKNGIPYLAPNQRLDFFLTSMVDNYNDKRNKSFKIIVTYENNISKSYKKEYLINFSHLFGLTQITDPIYNMSKNIESIKGDIKNFTNLFTREYAQEEVKRMIELRNKNNNSYQKSEK